MGMLGIDDEPANNGRDPEHELWKKFMIITVTVLIIAIVVMLIAGHNRKTQQQEIDDWGKALNGASYALVVER